MIAEKRESSEQDSGDVNWCRDEETIAENFRERVK